MSETGNQGASERTWTIVKNFNLVGLGFQRAGDLQRQIEWFVITTFCDSGTLTLST